MNRWLICGSRTLRDWRWAYKTLLDLERELNEVPDVVISGAAPGADSLGARFAYERGADVEAYGAKWKTEGKAAGPLRNARMLTEGQPTVVAALVDRPLVSSRGTHDMVERARTAGIPTFVYEQEF